ncbi:hypothetical protein GGS21DRAFT_549442 [Xylaria nigripes]|nr:hypothetical protein GGS21DRAFT_549442 [Xylaria nigripes]
MATAAVPSVEPSTYELIHTWAGQQRLTPEPLTEDLRIAVLKLERAIRVGLTDLSEPELGDTNWIEYRAVHIVSFREDDFTTNAVDPTGQGSLRWTCQVRVAEEPRLSFPKASEDGREISFARKKDAKKYAAKCAVEWLREQGFMSPVRVRLPTDTAALIKDRPPPPPQQQQQQQQQIPSKSNQLNKPGGTTTTIPLSPLDENQPSSVYLVSQLCSSLNLPSPSYVVESPDNDGLYNGYANFGLDRGLMPFDVSKLRGVTDVLGQKLAKEKIAKEVLEYLVAEKEKRDAELQAYLASSTGNIGQETYLSRAAYPIRLK